MNDVTNPFGASDSRSVAVRHQDSREDTQVLAMVTAAHRFPRDVVRAADRILNAFSRTTLAEAAEYQFARGGSNITGPSIRAAEAISQQWGNMSNGWSELARSVGEDGVGVSIVEAFSVDYEGNSREAIKFVVRHWRDTKSGGYALKDERDIYELCANQAQRRKRACILAQIPGDVTEMAMQQVAVTLKATADTSPEGVKKLADTFADLGITRDAIEKKIQRKLEAITPAQIVTLKRIYASLRDAMSEPSDWFEIEPEAAQSAGLEALRAAAQKRREEKAKGNGNGGGAGPGDAPSGAAAGAAPAAEAAANEPGAPAAGPAPAPKKATAAVMSALQKSIYGAANKAAAASVLEGAKAVVLPEQLATLAAVYDKRWPDAPAFDEAAFVAKLQKCASVDELDDTIAGVAAEQQTEPVVAAYRARRAELLEG
jgi:hypothetical protein